MKKLFVFLCLMSATLCGQVTNRKQIELPSNQVLFQPVPGAPQATNSFPGMMAMSPDGRYAVILNNGRGTEESKFQQSIAVLNLATDRLTDFPDLHFKLNAKQSLYYGLAFSSSGDEIYAAVGSLSDPEGTKPGDLGNGIAVYSFRDGEVIPSRFLKMPLQPLPSGRKSTLLNIDTRPGFLIPYPAGIAVLPSAGGDRLLVANNTSDNAVLIDAKTGELQKTFDLALRPEVPSTFPYGVVSDGHSAYVSLWNTNKVAELNLATGNDTTFALDDVPETASGSSAHPTAMLLAGHGAYLMVALSNRDQVVIVRRDTGAIEARLSTRLPGQKLGGAYPVSMALSDDETRLYVANSGTNAVMAYKLEWLRESAAGAAAKHFSRASLLGAIPTEWYPVAVGARGNDLLVATAKAHGIGPNNGRPPKDEVQKPFRYIGGLVHGSLAHLHVADLESRWSELTAEALKANRIADVAPKSLSGRSPIRHVIYIIKENRTYDQLFGDLGAGNGDSSLTMYGWEITPNHHRLAQQFGVLDNFYASGEVSGNGHVWSNAAITSDYTEKTWQIIYRGDERTYDFEGAVGNESALEQKIPDLDEPGTGFLWANASRNHLSYRQYGEFIESVWCAKPDGEESPADTATRKKYCTRETLHKGDALPPAFGAETGGVSPWPWAVPIIAQDTAMKPELVGHFDPQYADFEVTYPDQFRADEFLREFKGFVAARKRGDRANSMPQLIVMRLPNDHTAGTRPDNPMPIASLADNDLALGRIVEAVSSSAYWNDTAILVLEDDAQDGPDHVDAHRSPALVISKYSPRTPDGKPFVESGFFTTVNMIRTLEDLLRLPPMNHNDGQAAPMSRLFSGKGDQPAYHADDRNLKNGMIYRTNPQKAKGAAASAAMDWSGPDKVDTAVLNQILWEDRMGDRAMPEPKHTVIPEGAGSGEKD